MKSSLHRAAATMCIWLCIALGAMGIFLPLLPTTPFILLAAWIASKSSPKYQAWIQNHPRFGPLVDEWKQNKSIPLKAKILACILLGSSALFLLVNNLPAYLKLALILFLFCIAIFIVTRPNPR